MARSINYVPVDELLFEGYDKCCSGYTREEIDIDKPYIVIKSSGKKNTVSFRGKEIASEPYDTSLSPMDPYYGAASLELYHAAYRWLLHRLPDILRYF